ncbi:MAG: M14 family metallopeptidase [Candidatus Aminicenantes bacterium]|nr:M14 family metallopeptidase [Candidatus Aminicenantes bacterium]
MTKTLAFLLILGLAGAPAVAEVASLSQLFAPGRGVQDLDGDGIPEKVALTVIIPDNPTAAELALAADIAARANFESLVPDFKVIRKESEVENWDTLPTPILIGRNLARARGAAKEKKIDLDALAPNQGVVFIFSYRNRGGIVCAAGSNDALLKTGRAYFLRWPYFWEIWGRETGATYHSLEADLTKFLGQEDVRLLRTVVREARYEFPPAEEARGALKRLSFLQGEIRDLVVEVSFADEDDLAAADRALGQLLAQRRRGQRTDVLSYPACARLTFELWYGKKTSRIVLPRSGSSRRLLTPGFKERPRPESSERDFDLLQLFSAQGLYGDQDKDGILDAVESTVIVAPGMTCRNLGAFVSKLVLPTAGASFPLVYLDYEVESRKALTAPILVGANALSQELVRTGRVKLAPLESAWGAVQAVPKAFGKSAALLIHAPDTLGLDRTLDYLAQTFPFFDVPLEGQPKLADVARDFERFLRGEKGGAEAFVHRQLEKVATELKDRDLESLEVRLALPRENREFEDAVRKFLEEAVDAPRLTVKAARTRDEKPVFEKAADFSWEVDDALALLQERLAARPDSSAPLRISLGVSESLEVRQKVKKSVEQAVLAAGVTAAEVEVLSAYKPGFSWITERILPALKGRPVHRLLVRFAEEKETSGKLRRYYPEPSRWLQELYPVDEILARDLNLPLEQVEFEMKEKADPLYEVVAFDERNTVLLQQGFSPAVREMPYLSALPEWGTSRVTTGWLRLEAGAKLLADVSFPTDREKLWDFYQEQVLKPLLAYVDKKTGQHPTFSKQPYFKRLSLEVWLSEPDHRLGLDEELLSSLESLHDEVYFDTLDLLRGTTDFDPEEKDLPEDTSRASAPGNVLPLIHPSLEGGPGRARAILSDWVALGPQLEIAWKEAGRDPVNRTVAFPVLRPKSVRFPEFVYNGQAARIENLVASVELEKEADYLALLETLETWRGLRDRGLVEDVFAYPRLKQITVRLKQANLEKDEPVDVAAPPAVERPAPVPPRSDEAIVPANEIVSPERCLELADRLALFRPVRSYVGGESFEGRPVPVLELYTPLDGNVSLARLATFKPTLQLIARQHANEVSSTTYALRFAELVARDRAYQDVLRKLNIVIQPLENPDGAALAGELMKLEPFHCLHAGRYGALGMDIGYQTPANKALLPEASVRTDLYNRWRPDISLNLHGYPSHEWVQSFSGYVPFLFRDYWIPRGWFALYRSLTLPIYGPWKEAGEDLKAFITQELQADERIRDSNRRFYDRYARWASRWQPHLSLLEVTDGVNLYAKRRGSLETRLTPRTQMTFVEETPEIMDETAVGPWLEFLVEQGLAYLRAHIKYLTQTKFEVVRIEEEVRDRVRISFVRGRPGSAGKAR